MTRRSPELLSATFNYDTTRYGSSKTEHRPLDVVRTTERPAIIKAETLNIISHSNTESFWIYTAANARLLEVEYRQHASWKERMDSRGCEWESTEDLKVAHLLHIESLGLDDEEGSEAVSRKNYFER